MLYRVRGKTTKGNSVSGEATADSFSEAVGAVEEAAEEAGDSLTQITVKPLDAASGVRIAPPRKREAKAETATPKKKR